MIFHILFDDNSSFQSSLKVVQLNDEEGTDYTFLLDYDKAYLSMTDIIADIAEKLQVDAAEIELEEV